jgi:hypothetical protein
MTAFEPPSNLASSLLTPPGRSRTVVGVPGGPLIDFAAGGWAIAEIDRLGGAAGAGDGAGEGGIERATLIDPEGIGGA